MPEIRLTIPVPPSQNTITNLSKRHHMVFYRAKRKYQREAWRDAVAQAKPFRDPPAHVTIHAHLRVHNLRDEDKLRGSLAWVMDALRQAQTGKDWRGGLYSLCGYLIDDDPAHMTLGSVTQELDRSNKGLDLTIEYEEGA